MTTARVWYQVEFCSRYGSKKWVRLFNSCDTAEEALEMLKQVSGVPRRVVKVTETVEVVEEER